MSVMKNRLAEVKEFKFGQLSGNVEDFDDSIGEFKLPQFDVKHDFKRSISSEIIRGEREQEARSAFTIAKEVKEHRGLNQQENDDFEQRVQEELEKRLQAIQEQAYNQGFEEGKALGQEQAYEETNQILEQRVHEFSEQLAGLQSQMAEVYEGTKDSAYRMVKNLSKWIILKEVDEKYYLARLLEKLIHEINSKTGLVLHVNESSFGYMPEIIKIVERKVGKLTNVRVEVDLDMSENGIIIESENTIIDGSLDAQMASLDKLFTTVGIND